MEREARRTAGLKRRHAKKKRAAEQRAFAELADKVAALRDELAGLEQQHRQAGDTDALTDTGRTTAGREGEPE